MPVEDHEVHEKVKIEAGKPYGCSNRKGFAKGYYAPDREYRPDGTYYLRLVFIPHATSTSCRSFYLWDTDPRCSVCKAERDEAYADKMRGLE